MRLSTLILLVILGVIGYKIWDVLNVPKAPPPVAMTTPAAVTSPPAPVEQRPQEWPRSALEVIHGKVAQITADGLLISTTLVEAAPITGHRSITSENIREAQQKADDEDRRLYGPVMTMQNGTALREAREIPVTKASGMLMLKDYPGEKQVAPGATINVVAAPLGNLHYTVRFNAPPEKSGSWLQNYKGIMDPK
jgi:hypothetical protein